VRNGRPDFRLAIPGRITLAAVAPDGGANDDGTFACVASIFEQRIPRFFFDIVLRTGCFDRSLNERGLPSLVWSHDWQQPPIGTIARCEETDNQLQADGRLFIDGDAPDPLALRVYRAMRERNADGRAPLREFSIGFDMVDARWDVLDEDEVLAVYDGELYELGPTLVGAVSGTGFLQAPGPDELLARFPRPGHTAELSADARRERGLARARLL